MLVAASATGKVCFVLVLLKRPHALAGATCANDAAMHCAKMRAEILAGTLRAMMCAAARGVLRR